MRVLLTNLYLSHRTGSELATMELAIGLRSRGHEVAIYTLQPGALAEAVRAESVPVVDRCSEVPFRPDIIHAHHGPSCVGAAAGFPGVPIVFVSHGAAPWVEAPPDLSRIVRCLAVDRISAERVGKVLPRFADRVGILPNSVDLSRFVERPPLPARPGRALILTKYAEHIDTMRMAAEAAGLSVDALGPGTGIVVDDLPARLPAYDIVFATARMALEALAVGCAVIVVDKRGLAGMVRSADVSVWRAENFGLRLLSRPVEAEALRLEIGRYDPADAALASQAVREVAGLEDHIDRVEQLHAEAVAEAREMPSPGPARDLVEISAFISAWTKAIGGMMNPDFLPYLLGREQASAARATELSAALAAKTADAAALRAEMAALGLRLAAEARPLPEAVDPPAAP